ncbi:alcohol dehydrogenase [Actinomycetospora sp. NBRC 106375]|uniref:NDMA-dependent alcohol dehydrogenase n=1 Tax=Actinomycetospora sp. NBRC 106375 TaxID=3032207 RepID=UPI0024A4C352|nr:NDMA-dependent alcohol dehydrogenase [Actinomycetospora sp. NBRC 106375]GLZ49864.1 alcohol dehydrogenase [Actinomycetospora sp. NBRC 106375]
MRTRAAVLEKPGDDQFTIRELEVDEPGAGEVHIRYVASGLCHSDLHLIDGIIVPRYPIVAGHEGSGVVEAVGAGVTKVEPGDHVVCSFIPSCGHCRYCATGHQNLCDLGAHFLAGRLPESGFRYHADGTDYGSLAMLGTFSERATVPQQSVVRIDPWIPLDVAALVGCGVPTGWGSAVNTGAVHVGDATVVYGIGGIGINAVQGAVFAGAKYIVAIDPLDFKRQAALELGATHAFADPEEAAAKVHELTWGQGADQAIVTVGVVDEVVLRHAFDVIGKGSTVVVTGQSHPDNLTIQIPSALLVRNEKVIRGSQFGSSNPQYDILKLLRLYDSGHLKLDELVTKRYTLDQVNDGYQDLLDGKIIRGLVVHS